MQTGEAVRKCGCQIAVLAVHDPETVPGWKEGIQLSHVFHKCHGRETHEAVFIAPVELVLEIEGSAGKKYGRLASHIHVRKEKGVPLLPLVAMAAFQPSFSGAVMVSWRTAAFFRPRDKSKTA